MLLHVALAQPQIAPEKAGCYQRCREHLRVGKAARVGRAGQSG